MRSVSPHDERPAPGASPAADEDTRPAFDRGELPYAAFLAGVVLFILMLAARQADWGAEAAITPYLGALVAWLGFLPAIAWSVRRRHRPERTSRIPFLPVIGATYSLYYGIPVVARDELYLEKYVFTPSSLNAALVLALIGWLLLMFGWAVGNRVLRKMRPMHCELDWKRALRATPLLLGAGLAASLAAQFATVPSALVRPLRFLETFFELGLGILVLASFRHAVSLRTRRMLCIGLIPAWLFYELGTGAVAPFAYAAMFLLFLVWGSGRHVPVTSLVIAGSLVIILRGNVQEFRRETWEKRNVQAETGPMGRSAAFVELLVQRFQDEGWAAFERSTDQVVLRVAHLLEMAHIVQLTPQEIPYWEGETYATLPTTWIPRVLWPGKPQKRIGQEFGHRYGLLAPDDTTTAINLPQLVELYANFGRWGIVLGMALFGFLYRFLDRLWNTPKTGAGSLLLACLLLSRLTLIESDFTLVYGALVQETALLLLILHFLRRPSSGGAPQGGSVHTGNGSRGRRGNDVQGPPSLVPHEAEHLSSTTP